MSRDYDFNLLLDLEEAEADIARLDELVTALTTMVDAHTQRLNEAGLETDHMVGLIASMQASLRVLAERSGGEKRLPGNTVRSHVQTEEEAILTRPDRTLGEVLEPYLDGVEPARLEDDDE